MANITYRDAVGKALQDSMREESRLIIIGQNLTGHALKSLAETYGAERVRDCSISESAMVGIAVGAETDGPDDFPHDPTKAIAAANIAAARQPRQPAR